ncbi:metallophosphoesterase [Niveibacterium sp. 24ML]|uniref:metallophosphoesterase family protein n=1 Tax=Niveibacterium sp. 24ML TaxID=2985512 RepID=UPI00226E2C59|nr:metallophosphoesterase [Niveibacterium sp. 24ML]MCX9157776.1 metallophosphoesterase [Niveibacterium sp. 24ML]
MILLCGDPHGRFDHIVQAIGQHRPVAVILLGDIEAPQPLERCLAPILQETAVWWIPGNHDTDSDASHDHLWGSALAERNLHGRAVDVAGHRVAGLGGVFRGRIWGAPGAPEHASPEDYLRRCGAGNRWRGGLPRTHRSTIFPSDVQALGKARADLLVTHEAPSTHPHGFAALDALAIRLGVRHVFHGHHHADYRARIGDIEVVGVGLRGIVTDKGERLRAGECTARNRS